MGNEGDKGGQLKGKGWAIAQWSKMTIKREESVVSGGKYF